MKNSLIIIVLVTAIALAPVFSQELPKTSSALVGTWSGSLKLGAASLRIVFTILNKDGSLSGAMDSPDQGAKGIPVSKVSLTGPLARFDVKSISAFFEGTLSDDGTKLEGYWKQSGQKFPLALQNQRLASGSPRSPSPSAPSAPASGSGGSQEPAKPYPYTTVDVDFANASAKISLSGTLSLPEGEGPFPAVVLVTGSGPQNRDEELLGHKPFLVIADYLARRGVASLRYDDRGVGASKGDFATATSFDFAADARAGLAFLSARPEIDARRVGIVGHSEGALIAALVGSSDPLVSFIVMLAGPGVRGDKLLLMQSAAIGRAMGMDEKSLAEANALNEQLYDIALRPGGKAALKAEIVSILEEKLKESLPPSRAGEASKQAESAADQLLSPWTRTFLGLDPAESLSILKIPALAMNGSKDLQVPAAQNLEAIGLALKAAGNERYTLLELEGLNHLFQHASTGSPDEYASIPETFAPEALAAMGDWILSASR